MSAARRRRPRRRRSIRPLLVVLGLLVAFALGLGVGEALHDRPQAGGTQTLIRTLHPLPLVPIAQGTATTTVTTTVTTP